MIEVEWLFGIFSYLIGSIPNALIIGKLFFSVDVRDYGSGNPGATNVFRVLGKGPGLLILFLDISKGVLAVNLANGISIFQTSVMGIASTPSTDNHIVFLKILFGVFAIVGHILPLFSKFKGGKGVATSFGMLIALDYSVAICALLVFLITHFISGFVSLSSMMAGISVPLLFLIVFDYSQFPSVIIFSIGISLSIIYTHRKNISRLLAGQESKFTIDFKKRDAL